MGKDEVISKIKAIVPFFQIAFSIFAIAAVIVLYGLFTEFDVNSDP